MAKRSFFFPSASWATGIVMFLAALGIDLILTTHGYAQKLDAHEIYENSCSQCHEPHAGDFARANLVLKGNQAVSTKTGRSAAEYLVRGHGNLSPERAGLIADFLVLILQNEGLYQSHCRICHASARLFARGRLILRDDTLYGRYTDRKILEFLYGHGRMTKAEAEKLTHILSDFAPTATSGSKRPTPNSFNLNQ